MMKERHKTFKQIVVTAMILSLLLTIFGAMNNFSSYIGKLIAKYDISVILLLVAVVIYFQWKLISIRVDYLYITNFKDYDNNREIFYILLLTSVTSTLQVCLVSWIAAIPTFILWCITLVAFIVISHVDIPLFVPPLLMWCGIASMVASLAILISRLAIKEYMKSKSTKNV
jgi:hypothetical protein